MSVRDTHATAIDYGRWSCRTSSEDQLVLEDMLSLEQPRIMLSIESPDAAGEACVVLDSERVIALRAALRRWLISTGRTDQ